MLPMGVQIAVRAHRVPQSPCALAARGSLAHCRRLAIARTPRRSPTRRALPALALPILRYRAHGARRAQNCAIAYAFVGCTAGRVLAAYSVQPAAPVLFPGARPGPEGGGLTLIFSRLSPCIYRGALSTPRRACSFRAGSHRHHRARAHTRARTRHAQKRFRLFRLRARASSALRVVHAPFSLFFRALLGPGQGQA